MAGIVALALSYILSQFFRSFLAVMTPTLSAELGMTNAQFSYASGIWFVTFAAMQFAVGYSLDRFGPRRTAAVLLAAGAGGGALLFAIATVPSMVLIAMGLIGMGCAPLLMAPLFIFARTFSPARFAALASWFIAVGNTGNVLGAAPLAAVVESLGWRSTMTALAIISFLVAAGIWHLVRDPEPIVDETKSSGFGGFLTLLRMPVLWAIIPLTAVNYAPVATIRGLWAGPYLADIYGASMLTIGNVTFFMAIAMVAGSFLYGLIDPMFRTRKWVAFAGNFIGFVVLAFLFFNATPPFLMAASLLIVIGLFGMSYGVLIAHARSFFPSHLTGRGVTLMNFFSIGGTGVVQFATGPIFESASAAGPPESAYSTLFGFYALLFLVAGVIYLFSRDSKSDG